MGDGEDWETGRMFGDEIYRGDFKVVLQDYQPTPLATHAVYRRSRFYPAKIASFIHFLSEEFKLDPWVSSYGAIVVYISRFNPEILNVEKSE